MADLVLFDARPIRLYGRSTLDDLILVDGCSIRLYFVDALVEGVILEKRRPIHVCFDDLVVMVASPYAALCSSSAREEISSMAAARSSAPFDCC